MVEEGTMSFKAVGEEGEEKDEVVEDGEEV